MKPRYLITLSAFLVGVSATFCLVLAQWSVCEVATEPMLIFSYNALVSLSAGVFSRFFGHKLHTNNLRRSAVRYTLVLSCIFIIAASLSDILPRYFAAGLFVTLGLFSYCVKVFDQMVKNIMGKFTIRNYLKFNKLLEASRQASPLLAGGLGYIVFHKSIPVPYVISFVVIFCIFCGSYWLDYLVFKGRARRHTIAEKAQQELQGGQVPSSPQLSQRPSKADSLAQRRSDLPNRWVLYLSYVPYLSNLVFSPFVPIYIKTVLHMNINHYFLSFVVYGVGAILGTRVVWPYWRYSLYRTSIISTILFAAMYVLLILVPSYEITLSTIFITAFVSASLRTLRGTCLLENIPKKRYAVFSTRLESGALIAVVLLNFFCGMVVQYSDVQYGVMMLTGMNVLSGFLIVLLPQKAVHHEGCQSNTPTTLPKAS